MGTKFNPISGNLDIVNDKDSEINHTNPLAVVAAGESKISGAIAKIDKKLHEVDTIYKNFIPNSTFDTFLSGMSSYYDGASVVPVDGTGTDSSNVILYQAQTASAYSNGKYLLVQKNNGLNGIGCGLRIDIGPIDPVHRTNVFEFEMKYFSYDGLPDGYFRAYFYDHTNSKLYEISDRDIPGASTTINRRYKGTIQIPYGCEYGRILLHVTSTDTAFNGMFIDSMYFGPQRGGVSGAVITDPEQYTMNIIGNVTNPTKPTVVAVDKAFYWKEGKHLNITYDYKHTSSTGAANGSGSYFFPLPSGLVVDTDYRPYIDGEGIVGKATVYIGSTQYHGYVSVATNSTRLMLYIFNDTTPTTVLSSTIGFATNNTYYISFTAKVPILGRQSNMVLSEDAGNREIVAKATTSTTNINSTNVKVTFATVVKDTTASWADNKFTALETGWYDIDYNLFVTASAPPPSTLWFEARFNGSASDRRMNWFNSDLVASKQYTAMVSDQMFMTKGEYFEIYGSVGSNSVQIGSISGSATQQNYVSIAKRSSPQTIAQSEKVYGFARTAGVANGNIATGVETVIIYELVFHDSHGSLNTTTGELECKKSGVLSLSANFCFADATDWSAGEYVALDIYLDSSRLKRNWYETEISPAASNISKSGEINIKGVSVNRGQIVTIKIIQTSGNNRVLASAVYNTLSWEIN